MLTGDGARLLFEDRTLGWQAWSLDHRRHTLDIAEALPDLEDPATLGCLLTLVREARAEPCWLPTCLQDQEVDEAWVVETPSRDRQTRHESYAAVLVAALKAAEGREDTP